MQGHAQRPPVSGQCEDHLLTPGQLGKPSVLGITSEPPWPLNSGGHLRSFHLIRAIAGRFDARLVCPVEPHRLSDADAVAAAGIKLRAVKVPARSALSEAGRIARSLTTGDPYVMYGRHRWPDVMSAWKTELSRQPDVVYLDHLDGYLYWSAFRANGIPAVIDLHNVYSLLARRSGADQPNALTRILLKREATRLERVERAAARDCTVFAVSDQEAAHFRSLGAARVITVPNGVDMGAFGELPIGRVGPPIVVFIGTMSWAPNAAAARFLAGEVFPRLQQNLRDIRLQIIGRDPPADLRAMSGGGIEVTGTVPDIVPYLRTASLLAVPLEAGGGTRLKILEAFAAGVPVVSTAVGAEGIAATPGVHFVRAERREFATAIGELLLDKERAGQLASAGRALAGEKYDWKRIGDVATDAINELVGR
jgi:glycosyltransferase involved in cell wall biosynthesis